MMRVLLSVVLVLAGSQSSALALEGSLIRCGTDADCGADAACFMNNRGSLYCAQYTVTGEPCESIIDCHGGMLASCVDDSDVGKVCVERGEWVEGECSFHTDCGYLKLCQDGRCKLQPDDMECGEADECAEGTICRGATCEGHNCRGGTCELLQQPGDRGCSTSGRPDGWVLAGILLAMGVAVRRRAGW